MQNAILIPANPKLDFVGGGDQGSIIAHAVRIEEKGAVYWTLVVPGPWTGGEFPHEGIRTGYLFDVHEKRVTHLCQIDWIRPLSEMGVRQANRFCLESFPSLKRFEKRAGAFYAVKITSIFALKRIHTPADFLKSSDGKPVERVMNYCIVQDPGFAHHDKHVTRGEIMSNHMADLLLRGGVSEKDIEDLFFYRLMKNARILKRQGSFRRAGRLDLLLQDRRGNFIVYELKKGVAGSSALDQVKRYMNAYAKEHHVSPRRIRGVVLAQDADPELLQALEKQRRIQFKKYYFKVEMK